MSGVIGLVMLIGGFVLTISTPFIAAATHNGSLAFPLILACYGLVVGGISLLESKD